MAEHEDDKLDQLDRELLHLESSFPSPSFPPSSPSVQPCFEVEVDVPAFVQLNLALTAYKPAWTD